MRNHDASFPGGAGAETAVFTDRAPHLTAAFEKRVRRCRETVLSDRGIDHVAHYSGGVYDFAVDLLAASEAKDLVEMRRNHCREVGRRLSFQMTGLDRMLEEAHTGRLIRTVLHAESGVVYCHSVTPGEHVLSVTLRRATPTGRETLPEVAVVREADKAASDLTTAIRKDINLGPQDPGGWFITERPPAENLDPEVGLVGAGARVHGQGSEAALARCRPFLDPEILPYVAHYRDGVMDYTTDLFEDERIGRFFTHITAEARRSFYAQIGRGFTLMSRQLAQLVRPLCEGRLLRVVLDVEQGAIFYYRIASGAYLIGVTLNQAMVSRADDQFARLAAELSPGPGV